MKFRTTLTFHERLIDKLGDDLVYTVSYDNGQYFLSISTHNSKKQRFKHGRRQQTAVIEDYKTANVHDLVKQIVKMYRPILIKIGDEEK
jgi:hypothetical protein